MRCFDVVVNVLIVNRCNCSCDDQCSRYRNYQLRQHVTSFHRFIPTGLTPESSHDETDPFDELAPADRRYLPAMLAPKRAS